MIDDDLIRRFLVDLKAGLRRQQLSKKYGENEVNEILAKCGSAGYISNVESGRTLDKVMHADLMESSEITQYGEDFIKQH